MQKALHLTNTTLVITMRCNLKCKLCAVSVPYYEHPEHYSLEMLQHTVDRYFMAVDTVEKFTINGGEPFTHPQLPELMDYLLQYQDRIGMLEILTNGSLAPSQSLIDVLAKSNKTNVLIDDYGPQLSKKVSDAIAAFEQHGVAYRHRTYHGSDAHCGGWVDLTRIGMKNRSSKETAEIYAKCAYPGPFHCLAIFGGKAYICGVYKKCVTDGLIPDVPSEYIDFLAEDYDLENVRTQIASFHQRSYFSACAYCDGFCPDSHRYIPAEQLGGKVYANS